MRHALAFIFAFTFCAVGLVLVVPPKLCGTDASPTALSLGTALLSLAFVIALPTDARQAFTTLRELWPFGRARVGAVPDESGD